LNYPQVSNCGLGDLLVFLESEYEVARTADCHSSGKPVRKFDFVE
jgi:hypothetical protein